MNRQMAKVAKAMAAKSKASVLPSLKGLEQQEQEKEWRTDCTQDLRPFDSLARSGQALGYFLASLRD